MIVEGQIVPQFSVSCAALMALTKRVAHSNRRLLYAMAYIAIFSVGLVSILCFCQFTVDDAFIVFRYPLNFVERGVWNWNLEGAPVEAYTGFLELIPFVIGLYASINLVLLAKFIGGLCVTFMAIRLVQETRSGRIRLLALAILLANPYTYIHAFSGLETPIVMALILEIGIILARRYEAPIRLPVLCLALALTRPDGALLSLAAVAIYSRQWPINRKFLSAVAVIAVLAILYNFWRIAYFGALFPNTYYAKRVWATATTIPANFFDGRYYLFVLGIAAVLSRGPTRLILLVLLVTVLFSDLPSSLIMNYADRFFFQFALPGVLIFLLQQQQQQGSTRSFRTAAVLAGIFLVTTFNYPALKDTFLYTAYNHGGVDLGKRLRPLAGNDVVLCTEDVGVIPYFSHWHTLDALGLANRDVARSRGITEKIFEREHPSLVLFSAATPDPSSIYVERYGQANLLNYVRERHFAYITAAYTGEYYVVSYVDPKNAKFSAMKTALLQNAAIANAFRDLPLTAKIRQIVIGQIGFRDFL